MKDRLIYLQQQLQRLADNYAIASQWQSDFASLQNEVTDMVHTYVEAVAPPPAIVYQAMTADDIATMAGTLAARVVFNLGDLTTIQGAIQAEIQQSDVTVLAAIAETRAELLAAKPAEVPA